MIIIKRGTFGWFNGRRVIPLTEKDGPVSLDKGLEKRLVAEGVAVWAEDPSTVLPDAGNDPDGIDADGNADEADAGGDDDGEAVPDEEDLDELTVDELKEIAVSKGVTVGKMRKAEIIEAIREADEPPAFEAAEVED